jgi:hypothetical protein
MNCLPLTNQRLGWLYVRLLKIINIVFKSLISWLVGQNMKVVMLEFKNYNNLPNVHGAIDITHISNSKPKISFAKDYFYHKT